MQSVDGGAYPRGEGGGSNIEGDPRARRRHAVGHGCGDRRERDRRNAHLLRYRAESLVMPITRQSG